MAGKHKKRHKRVEKLLRKLGVEIKGSADAMQRRLLVTRIERWLKIQKVFELPIGDRITIKRPMTAAEAAQATMNRLRRRLGPI